jgi:hypothetical protein
MNKKIVTIIILIIFMFVSFFISALFVSNSGAFDENGDFDLEQGIEILRELDRVPFIQIDIASMEENLKECLEKGEC